MTGHIVDLSQPVDACTPVYPGDGPVRVTVLTDEPIHLSRIEFCVHTGTHMDAPCHFFKEGETIDRVPLGRCIGPARLIDLRGLGTPQIRRRDILQQDVESLRGHAAVLQTGWSIEWGQPRYFNDHPVLLADAAEFLVEQGVNLVAVDMPSVDHAPYAAHRILLDAGVPIVENLTNLESLQVSLFQLIVLPLRLMGRDGSPVRAIAIE